jgi:L-aminopeptidase/D-esterase-like protein
MSTDNAHAQLAVRFAIRTAGSSVFTLKAATSVRHNSPEGFKIERSGAIEPSVLAGLIFTISGIREYKSALSNALRVDGIAHMQG